MNIKTIRNCVSISLKNNHASFASFLLRIVADINAIFKSFPRRSHSNVDSVAMRFFVKNLCICLFFR